MANEQMTFSLGIKTTADMTGINQLKASLNELSNSAKDVNFLNKSGLNTVELAKASDSVRKLGSALDTAFDVRLNGINFNTFQQNLKASGTTLTEIGTNMSKLGPQGVAAFSQMTSQVFKMNTAVQYTNKLADKLWTTFKNTIMYTGFNAALNTASQAISRAVGYTKDLDKSLNNIRIVSGQSAEQMKEFAVQANNAAKALGSSTTDYTDAALIYYQQNLTETDVTERVNVTQKMANVTGDSADKISQDLTAIWNNFYDGSKSLEYYADAITKLGASTAASTSEISEGLEKFAAIADTVELSYEYATAAVATVVAETRQSADTVGTAFKTIFGRLEGLELGETLDDGTSLNKYSQALMNVGINIKQNNGELKSMDAILDELGAKWVTLNKDQQVALAQTVGGTRQYTQLVALMDNWNKVRANIDLARGSEGELQKQQDIYMESTAAHLKQLQAAAEDLYSSLFNSKDMHTWIDGLTKGVGVIDNLVESLGGLNNIVPMLAFGGINAMSGKLAEGIAQSSINKQNNLAAIANDQAQAQFINSGELNNINFANLPQASAEYEKQLGIIKEMSQYTSQMSQADKDRYNNLVDAGAQLVRHTAELEKQKVEWEAIASKTQGSGNLINGIDFNNTEQAIIKLTEGAAGLDRLFSEISTGFRDMSQNGTDVERVIAEVFDAIGSEVAEAGVNVELLNKEITRLAIENEVSLDKEGNFRRFERDLRACIQPAEDLRSKLVQVKVEKTTLGNQNVDIVNKQELQAQIQGYIQLASSLGQVAMGIQTIKNLGNIWSNKDISLGERLLQTMMNLGMTLPMLVSSYEKLQSAGGISSFLKLLTTDISSLIKVKETEEALIAEETTAIGAETAKRVAETAAVKAETLAEEENLKIKLANLNISNSTYKSMEGTAKRVVGKILKSKKEISVEQALGTEYSSNIEKRALMIELIEREIAARKAETDATNKEVISEQKEAGALEISAKAHKDNIKATKEGTAATNLFNKALKAGPLLAIAAVIAALAIIEKQYAKVLEQRAEGAQKAADTSQELADQAREERDKTQELAEKYKELKSQLDDNTLSKEDMKNQAYQLCMKYGLEAEAVEALSDHYDKLAEKIKEVEIQKAEAASAAAETAYIDQNNATKASLKSGAHNNIVEQGLNIVTGLPGVAEEVIDKTIGKGPSLDLTQGLYGNLLSGLEVVDNVDLAKQINDLAGEEVIYGLAEDKLDLEKFQKLYNEKNSELLSIIANAEGSRAEVLQSFLADQNESLEKSRQSYLSMQESQIAEAEIKVENEDINNINDYVSAINQLKTAYSEANMSAEEARQALDRFLSTTSNEVLADYGRIGLIGEAIFGEDDWESHFNEIKYLTDNQLEYLAGHVKTAKSYLANDLSLNEFFRDSEANIGAQQLTNKRNAIDSVLMEGTKRTKKDKIKKTELTAKDIEEIFNDGEPLRIKIGENWEYELDEQAFRELDYGTQMTALANANIVSLDEIHSKSEEVQVEIDKVNAKLAEVQDADYVIDWNSFLLDGTFEDSAFEAKRKEIEGKRTELQNLWENSKTKSDSEDVEHEAELRKQEEEYRQQLLDFDKYCEDFEKLRQEDIENFKKYAEDGLSYEDYSKEESRKILNAYAIAYNKDLSSFYTQGGRITLAGQQFLDNIIKSHSIDQNISRREQLQNQLQDLNDTLSNLDTATYDDWIAANLEANAAMEVSNKDLDNLQANYQTLSGAVEEYNENGRLSCDTLQALIQMNSDYLACLENENGQLTMKTDSLEIMFEAQKNELKLAATNQLITELNAIALRDSADAELTDAQAIAVNSLAMDNMTASARENTEALIENIAALKGVNLSADELSKKKYQNAIQAYKIKLTEIDKMNLSDLNKNKKSSSTKKKDKKDKYYEDEFDRYWEINKALDKLANTMERLNKIQEKLHGPELIKSLQKENELIGKKIEKEKELFEEQKKDLGETNGRLANSGFTFDETGEITNYKAQTQKLYKDYQAVIDGYNAGTVTEKEYDKATQVYEKMKKDLSRHDEDVKKVRDTHNLIEDLHNEVKDNNLKGWEEQLKLRLDTHEAARDWNDFFGKINEDFKSIYTDFDTKFKTSVFDSKSLGKTFSIDSESINHVKEEIDKMMAGGESKEFQTVAQARERLKELSDQMRDDASKIFDLYKQGWDDFNSYIDEAIGKMDKIIDKYERINEDLDHQNKLIELLYGQNDYENLDKLYEAKTNNYLGELASLRDQANFFEEQYKKMAKLYGEDSDAAQKFKESWEKAIDSLHSKEEEYLSNLADQYVNTLNKAFDNFERNITGGSHFDFVLDQWDLSKAAAEDVYDEQEKIYQLQTLGNKYQEAINKASTTKAQQKLTDLYKSQVKALEDKTTLTKYDVELAEKRLAVAEAEAALEDARNNKNTLKVTRGDDGNWAYQYVADDDDTDDKEQDLLDAQYDAYEYVKSDVSDRTENYIKTFQEYENKVKDIQSKMIGATDEQKAEYEKQLEWYQNYYAERLKTIGGEVNTHEVDLAVETNALLQTEYFVNEQNYQLMTEHQKELINGLRDYSIQTATDVYNATDETMTFIQDKGTEVMTETIDYFSTAASEITNRWAVDPDSVVNIMLETLTTCQEALQLYVEMVEEGCIAAGEKFTDVGAAIDRDTEATNNLADATAELIDEVSADIDEYIGYLNMLEDEWSVVNDWIQENITSIMEYLEKISEVKTAMDEVVTTINQAINDLDTLEQKSNNSSSSNSKGTFGKSGYNGSEYITSDNKTFRSYQEAVAAGYTYDDSNNRYMTMEMTPDRNSSSTKNDTKHTVDVSVKDLEYNFLGTKVNKLRLTYDDGSTSELIDNDANAIKRAINAKYGNSSVEQKGSLKSLIRQGIVKSFNTGGYTGDWSDNSGRMAMLHQKELVLNAEDTENMLATVSAVRDLSSVQSNIQNAVAESITKALMSIAGLGTSTAAQNISTVDSSQNNIWNINAPIQSANGFEEIQRAILDLPNAASQAIGRQNK